MSTTIIGRPRIGVTDANKWAVCKWVSNLLRDDKRSEQYLIGEEYIKHVRAAEDWNQVHQTTRRAVADIDVWTQKWLTAEGWQRCLAAIRQESHRERVRSHQVTLSREAYFALDEHGRSLGITLSSAVLGLLETYRAATED